MRSTYTLSVSLSVDIVNLLSCVALYRALFPRYYFNSESQRCEQFDYGGCEGNENNFQSLGECRAECSGLPVYVYIGRLFRSSQSMCTLAVCSGPPSLCVHWPSVQVLPVLAVCSGPPSLCVHWPSVQVSQSMCTLAVCSGPPSLCVHWPSVQVLPVYVYIGRLFRSSQSMCTLAVCSGPPSLCVHWPSVQVLPVYVYIGRLFRSPSLGRLFSSSQSMCTLAVCSGPPSLCVHWPSVQVLPVYGINCEFRLQWKLMYIVHVHVYLFYQ